MHSEHEVECEEIDDSGIQHGLSDADYKAGAQTEIILDIVSSVRQTGKQIVCLDGPDRDVPGDWNVESAACDHCEIGCRAGGPAATGK
jgi:hypothetical protein